MVEERQAAMPSTMITRRRILYAGAGVASVGVAGTGAWLSRTQVGIVAPGRSRARPIVGASVPPPAVDVVVVGGGFVGVSAALALAERGVSVALLEKGVVAGEASGRSMGFVDSQFADPIKVALISRSKEIWHGLNARVGGDTGYRQTGLVATLPTADAIEDAHAWLASVKGVPGFEGRIVLGAQLRTMLPGMRDAPPAAMITDTDASVEPRLAAPAIAEGAMRRGAHLVQHCAVRGIETTNGRISGAMTEKGAVRCHAVILAGGAWSSLFAESLGVNLPQFEIYLSMLSLAPVPGAPRVPLSGDGYGFRPQTDGGYSFGTVDFAVPILPETIKEGLRLLPNLKFFGPMASVGLSTHEFVHQLTTPRNWALDRPSPFEEQRILEPKFRNAPYPTALDRLRRHFPAFADARISERWAGVISTTLDNVPVIGAVDGHPGLYVGSGFSYGLTMGPAAGEALADLAMGRKPAFPLNDFRLARFSDGTKMTFHA